MKKFKVIFPSGYQINDIENDNIDINVILDNGKVFFATIFTIKNLESLLLSNGSSYFWSTDMFILKDLRKDTIDKSISNILNEGYLEEIFSEIGTIESIYPKFMTFDKIINMVTSEDVSS